MNEREYAKKLIRQLNRAPIPPKAADRLRAARGIAVAHAMAKASPGWSRSGNVLVRFWHQHQAVGVGLLLVLLLAVAGGGWQWQQHREAERALEVQLLSDELPVELFLSESF